MNRNWVVTGWAMVLVLCPTGASQAQNVHRRPTLYLLSVGISNYENPQANLNFCAKDARDMAMAFQEQKWFKKVVAQVLVDNQATRKGIEENLARLAKLVGPDDYFIVYLAGHGGGDALGNYQFIPYNYNELLKSTGLPGRVLRKYLKDLPGKGILILDTCHAAGATLNIMPQGKGFVTFAACLVEETSAERDGNGLFTRAFIEGLVKGKADFNQDGVVTLAEMDAYTSDRVYELSGGAQQVTLVRPAFVPSRLPLGVIQQVMAPLTSRPPATLSDLISRPPSR